LLAGLAIALLVIFSRPLAYLLDVAREVQQSSGLALIPALIILTGVFLLHLQSKRQEARLRASSAEEETRQAHARTSELERLVVFGQALGRSLDTTAIRDVLLQHLAELTGTRESWVMTRMSGRWALLAGPSPSMGRGLDELTGELESLLPDDRYDSAQGPLTVHEHLCLPVAAAGDLVGLIGIPESAGPLTEARQRLLATAGTLLGISLRNAALFREVRESSLRDGLTGCFNRTYALDAVAVELRRARRSHLPLSLMMFDIDRFKEINDRHGHLCGDAVLAAVGARMRAVLRGSDLKCRYGGEEFLVLLPDTPLEGAIRAADTLRRDLADLSIPWKNETVTMTASFGVAAATPSEIDAQAVIGRADAALYRAKNDGRNCVCLSAEPAVA
jgi:diguanylate cyclase (GGDEF)-like protein